MEKGPYKEKPTQKCKKCGGKMKYKGPEKKIILPSYHPFKKRSLTQVYKCTKCSREYTHH